MYCAMLLHVKSTKILHCPPSIITRQRASVGDREMSFITTYLNDSAQTLLIRFIVGILCSWGTENPIFLNVPICPPLQHVLLLRYLSSSRQGTVTSFPPSDGVGGCVDPVNPFISVNIHPSHWYREASIDGCQLLAVATW